MSQELKIPLLDVTNLARVTELEQGKTKRFDDDFLFLLRRSRIQFMKHEWRKVEKEYYLPKQIAVVDVPEYNFITIEGAGDPNSEAFSEQITAIYPVAYALRMGLKKGEFDNEPFEYTVYPLEGVWTTSDGSKGEELNKEALVYKIMVRQPEVVTKEMFEEALEKAKAKKPNKYFDQLKFEKYTEGKAAQTIHIGPFDEEPKTFAKLDEFLQENNLKRINTMGEFIHREIYLSDFRRVAPEKRKTVLRYRVTDA